MAEKRFELVAPSAGLNLMPKFAGARSRIFSCCCPDMMARIVGTVSVICCRVPVGDTVGAAAVSGARPVLSLVGMLLGICVRSRLSCAAWLRGFFLPL